MVQLQFDDVRREQRPSGRDHEHVGQVPHGDLQHILSVTPRPGGQLPYPRMVPRDAQGPEAAHGRNAESGDNHQQHGGGEHGTRHDFQDYPARRDAARDRPAPSASLRQRGARPPACRFLASSHRVPSIDPSLTPPSQVRWLIHRSRHRGCGPAHPPVNELPAASRCLEFEGDRMTLHRCGEGRRLRRHLVLEPVPRRVVRHGLFDDALFHTEVTELTWDEPRTRWVIRTSRGDRLTPTFVVLGTGPLSVPKLPGIPGIGSFGGHSFAHQPVALRLHRRRRAGRADAHDRRQAGRHHQHQGDRGPGRPASVQDSRELYVFQAHADHRSTCRQRTLPIGPDASLEHAPTPGQHEDRLATQLSDHWAAGCAPCTVQDGAITGPSCAAAAGSPAWSRGPGCGASPGSVQAEAAPAGAVEVVQLEAVRPGALVVLGGEVAGA